MESNRRHEHFQCVLEVSVDSLRSSRSQVVASTVLVAMGMVLGDQIPAYLAARRLQDGRWWRETPSVEKRLTAHAALGYWFGDPHDAVVVLMDEGDRSSVPYLK